MCARTLRLGTLRRLDGRRSAGTGSAVLATLPDFLTASVLATVVGVQLGWLPALGWYGPRWTVLPALSLGLPAGALPGRLLDDLLPGTFAEPWAAAAAARGVRGRAVARQALRRCVPGLLPNAGLFVVGLTGGAVAVEQVFDIPGLGRLCLQAAVAQDLPVLQAGTLALVVLAAAVGGLARLAARPLIGPALRDDALPSPHRPAPPRSATAPLPYGGPLLAVVALGLTRDPLELDTAARLRPPSPAHPFGTDALGRDLLARVGQGALDTLVLAGAVSAAPGRPAGAAAAVLRAAGRHGQRGTAGPRGPPGHRGRGQRGGHPGARGGRRRLGLVVLAGGAATGSLLDTGLPPAVPWLVLAALPVAAVALLPRGAADSCFRKGSSGERVERPTRRLRINSRRGARGQSPSGGSDPPVPRRSRS